MTNAVSDSGEVFFETMEKLVPADENETWDVYEYGGGEGPSAQLHLISSGKSEEPSYFADATPDGSNLFFYTFQSLLRGGTRIGYALYDARVDGGFASQEEAVQPPACEAVEACRTPVSEPPAEFSAGSAVLFGGGNLVTPVEQPVVKKPAKGLTRAKEVANALKACKKDKSESKRVKCEKTARKKYGAANKSAAKRSSNDRRASR